MKLLEGKAALITGGTQGVGAAIARSMAAAGADLVLHGRQEDESAEAARQACADHGVRVELVFGDLARPTETCVAELFESAVNALPAIDVLVNNAGGYFDPPFLELDLATFERTMRVNVYAHLFLTQQFARRWIDRRVAGRVLFTGSINGLLAEPVHASYDISKGAVEMMVRTLCVELAPHGIRVNGLAPGLVYTPLTAPALDRPAFQRWMQLHTPNGRVPGPEACGEAAVFLVSDGASHIAGQMLRVDGGMSVWQQPDLPSPGVLRELISDDEL